MENVLKKDLLNKFAKYSVHYSENGLKLSSGKISPFVIDAGRILRHRDTRVLLEILLIDLIKNNFKYFDAVAGPSLGADPICASIYNHFPCHWLSVRKEPKPHGFDSGLIIGPTYTGVRALIVEDVLTTGRSISRVFSALSKSRCEVVGVLCVVERTDFSGRSNLGKFLPKNTPIISILTSDEIFIKHRNIKA